MKRLKQVLSLLLSCSILLGSSGEVFAQTADQGPPTTPVVSAKPTQQQLQQLVAPIALYPDSLVAQILAAATYPDQVVQADRWVQAHPELKGDALAQAVDQQPWDPGVKALSAFPSVLSNMDKNLSWTSSLGDAYINNQEDVMKAVQTMREAAKKAGNLKSNSQMNVTDQGQTIIIEPASPEVVYVPMFDPWLVYGYPVAPWPGWYWYPGLYWTSPGLAFGVGFGVGFFGGFGWGWHNWAPDWHHDTIIYNHITYVSHSRTVINRNYYVNRARTNIINRGAGYRGGFAYHGGAPAHVAPVPHAPAGGFHPGAFGGFHSGAVTRGYSSRGFASMGGFHGGMRGFHGGGGFHGAGGRR